MQWNKEMKTYVVKFGNDPFTIEVQAYNENAAIKEARSIYDTLTCNQGRHNEPVATLKTA